jgi:hypothetical protein
MKVKRKLEGNCIVLTIRLQSAIEVHLFNQATFVHDSYDTDMSEFDDNKYNKQHHRFGSMNLTIHKSGDILFSNSFGVIKEGESDIEGTYEQVNSAVDRFVHYIRESMGV